MAIETKTFNQLLGELVRKILPNTPLNDIAVGSALYTLLEAVAASDFDNNSSILSVLELLTLDALTNNDLDNRAADYGMSRLTAQRASGLVSISDSTITKRSTGLYAVKPAPIAGSSVVYVNDASNWQATGYLYIGRGTQSFEGPIPYISITNNGSFYAIQLGAVLQKDHLISDMVVDQQGKLDRAITAGTIVRIPSNNQMPEINYTILRDAVIPAGEDEVTGVPIIADRAGSFANASIGTIVQFGSVPFTGAEVVNSSALTDGRDIESDGDLRERIKSYASTLARGTKDAILASIIGVADSEESKQVVSAVISEPPTVGEPAILYVDDGRGFQPSTTGQSVDTLLASANGNEEFLQLSNYPLPRPQAVNTTDGPYELKDGTTLYVYVDGIEESVQFRTTHFNNISSATLPEIVIAINDNATLFKCRLANNSSRLLIYPTAFDTESIQVVPLRSTDNIELFANNILKFPTNVFSYISLYRNNQLLHEKETSASLLTVSFPEWQIDTTGNLIIAVDNTPPQNQSFTTSDFGGREIETGTVEEWVAAFNAKFAGITANITSSGAVLITSNRSGTESSLEILGGSYFTKIFADNPTTSQGQQSDFDLNRQTGNLRIKTGISVGDSISAGTADAKGNVISSNTLSGSFNVSSDSSGRASNAVLAIDDANAKRLALTLAVGSPISFSLPTAGVLRVLASNLNSFASVQPRDFIYIAYRSVGTWASQANTGLFKVVAVGGHTQASIDTYVDVACSGGVAESIALLALDDIMAFRLNTYPQIWNGTSTPIPASAPLAAIINSINNTTVNIRSSVFKTSALKTTSASEANGSIAILATSGAAGNVFPLSDAATGNQSHIANKITSKELASYPKRNRTWGANFTGLVTSELSGNLTSDSIPSADPSIDPYENLLESAGLFTTTNLQVDDLVSIVSGSNKGITRSIKDIQAASIIGTQHALPRARLPFITGDSITIYKSLSFTPEDNIVFIIDQDSVNKTVVVPMSRTGRIHSMFPVTNYSFSAYDADNEPGITFDSVPVWGTTINKTDFRDYAVWFKARNWYSSGGAGSGLAAMVIRAAEYGPHGDNFTFRLEYPTVPNQTTTIQHLNKPSSTAITSIMGSGDARAIGITSGLQFDVIDQTNDIYRYQFSGAIDLSAVQAGDIVGITNTSGVSSNNNGSYRIVAKGIDYVDVYNPNGAETGLGIQEETDVTCGADIVGTPTIHDIIVTSAATIDGKYFTLNDDIGKVVFWYDVDNNGTPAPTVSGAYRYVKIATVISGDTSDTVANRTYVYINTDTKFAATVALSTVTVTNQFNGDTAVGTAGDSGFTVTKTSVGTANNSLNGKYFIIQDENSSVAVWYNVSGIEPEPFHGASRSISISTVDAGDAAGVVATKTAALLTLWTPSVASNVISLTDPIPGGRSVPSAGTLSGNGYTLTTTANGSNPDPETIVVPTSFNIYPLTGNSVQDIVDVINAGSILEAVAISSASLLFEKATRDEVYTPVGPSDYSASLSYGHNPDPTSGNNTHIHLYDSQSWVKSFQNAGPNFTLKANLVLNGAAPLAYNAATVPNKDSSDLGEMFKLIPVTLANVRHQFTQKALSQLPIVSEIDVANAFKSIQIKSKKLGSEGAVEVVGGRANEAEFSIFGEAQNITESGTTYTEIKTAAYPITLNVGDYIELYNTNEVKRKSSLLPSDKINVVAAATSAKYVFQPKSINVTGESVDIVDVSATYSKTAGTIWRWSFTDIDLAAATTNDLLIASGLSGNWSPNNQVRKPEGFITGFPIVAVDDLAKVIDVVNPFGQSMLLEPIGAGSITIVPAIAKRWHTTHTCNIVIDTLSIASGIASVQTASQHSYITGDSIFVESGPVSGAYPITYIDAISFSFAVALPDSTYTSGLCRKDGVVNTHYVVESLGGNNFYRLRYVSGSAPRFITNGVAVDDTLIIKGLTFKNSNTGRFKVYAANDTSIVFQNALGSEELDTIKPINNFDTAVTWTANVNTVTGAAGSFNNVVVGSWVKKVEDNRDYYVQVIAKDSISLTLGSNYKGTSSISQGVAFHMTNDVGTGVELKHVDDVMFFEGDSAFAGDMLFVDDIVNDDWFSIQNTGTFDIQEVQLDNTNKPYIQAKTSANISESDVLMSVDTNGLYVLEGMNNQTTLVKEIKHIAIDEFDPNKRAMYLFPSNFSDKISQTYGTKIKAVGKLGYSSDVTTGIDGYLYYTGLMRKVQRIIDGFEPDPSNYPGRRAVGSAIESLPPLIRRVKVSLEVTTNDGVNLNEISNDIISTIINYVTSLGVGQDVILSEVIVQVMSIRGVAAVTFTSPAPSQERIPISDIEKAYIESSDISVA